MGGHVLLVSLAVASIWALLILRAIIRLLSTLTNKLVPGNPGQMIHCHPPLHLDLLLIDLQLLGTLLIRRSMITCPHMTTHWVGGPVTA